MYITAGRQVVALDATTGGVKWKFSAPAALTRRGVSYWPGDTTHPARIYTGSGDKMLALDAVTGEPLRGFGDAGFVDMKSSIKGDVDGQYSMASPPTVYKNILITGGNNGEGSPSLGLHGDIRAWDAVTGLMLLGVPHRAAGGRARRRDVGRQELEGSIRNEHLVVFHGRRRTRRRLRADGRANLRLLRRRPQGRQPLRQHAPRARRVHRQAQVVPPDRASRPLGFRSACRACADHRPTEQPERSGRRRDDEDEPVVRLQPRHRRTDLRHGGTPGAAEQRTR